MTDGTDEPTFVKITNQMVYAELQSVHAELRELAKAVYDYGEGKKRVRSLELKFYGVLAGLLTAVAIIIAGIPK